MKNEAAKKLNDNTIFGQTAAKKRIKKRKDGENFVLFSYFKFPSLVRCINSSFWSHDGCILYVFYWMDN